MNRRRFMILSGVSALALMLPHQAPAALPAFDYSKIPIAKLELIEQALDVGERYGFNISERIWQFGWERRTASTVKQLREVTQEYVLEWGAVDQYNRLRFLVAVRQELERQFPNDIDAQIRRLHQPAWPNQPAFKEKGRAVRELMNGDYFELWNAALALGSDVDSHGFAEMRAFV